MNEEETWGLNSTAWMRIKLGSNAERREKKVVSLPQRLHISAQKFPPTAANKPPKFPRRKKPRTRVEQRHGRGEAARGSDGEKEADLRLTLLGLGCLRRDIVARMMMMVVVVVVGVMMMMMMNGGDGG